MNKQIVLAVCAAAAAVLGGAGCSKKVPECNAVIEVYNKGLDASRAVKDDDTAKAATVWAGIGADLGKLEITTPELKTIATKMQTAITGASHNVGKEGGGAKEVQEYLGAAKELQTFCGVEEKK